MSGNPNVFAHLALLLWLPLSLGAFWLLRPTLAASVVLLGGLLLLPVGAGFDFPGLPAFDKGLIANLCALSGVVIFARGRLRGQRIGRGIEALVFLLMAGAVLTAFANRDPLVYGSAVLPSMGPWDATSSSIRDLLMIGVPFVLGRVLFRRSKDLRLLFVMLAAAGLAYSLFILFELTMSPKLHRIVYGYRQHWFHQTVRMDSYRPMVFMAHGLALAIFVLASAMAATALARAKLRISQLPGIPAAIYLSSIVLLCRSLGAILYGAAVLPIVALARPLWQIRIAWVLSILVLSYPATRAIGLFPTEILISVANVIDEQRAQSLEFRFGNEDQLLEKARERIWFGWGGYNRNRVFDPIRGRIIAITDGYWIIQLGMRGIVGFVGAFGLLLFPIWRAHWQLQRIRSPRDRALVATLGLIMAIYSVDLIPNGFLSSFTFFLSGALAGLVPGLQAEQRTRGSSNSPRRLPARPAFPMGVTRNQVGAPALPLE